MKAVKKILGGLAAVSIVLGGLEVGLRFEPGLIPLSLLKRFQRDLRIEIAQRRSLWNESQMWELERDDGGPPLTLFKPNSRIVYKFGENENGEAVMDDQGFCNPHRDSYDVPKIGVIAVGDSFTWCVLSNPEATWVSQIGEITDLSVYNLGRGGIGPYDYMQILKYFGLPKNPDYVVMNIYEGNDLRDSDRYHQHVAAGLEERPLYSSAADRSEHEFDYDAMLGRPVLQDSYAINFAVTAFGKAYESVGNAYLRATGGDAPEKVNFRYRLNFPDAVVDFNVQNADESEVRYAKNLKAGEVNLSAFDAALNQFVTLSKKYDFTPVVAYSPSAYTAYADYVEFEDESLSDLMPWFSRTQRSFLRNKAEEIGYVFVDLTPAIQSIGRSLEANVLLYQPINVHFTNMGNRVVAEALAEVIKNREMDKMADRE